MTSGTQKINSISFTPYKVGRKLILLALSYKVDRKLTLLVLPYQVGQKLTLLTLFKCLLTFSYLWNQ